MTISSLSVDSFRFVPTVPSGEFRVFYKWTNRNLYFGRNGHKTLPHSLPVLFQIRTHIYPNGRRLSQTNHLRYDSLSFMLVCVKCKSPNEVIEKMFHDAFEKLELEDIARILDEANPMLDGMIFDPVETVMLALPLSFYPGYRLLDIADHSSLPHRHRQGLYKPGEFIPLDFTNRPIYKLNESLPIALNDKNVTDYARFFFMYVRGKKGRFLLVESVDEIYWREDPPPQARKAIGQMITPLTLEKTGGGDFCLSACFMYKEALFKALVKINSVGLVQLSDEEILIEDVPVLDDTFRQ